MDNSSAHQPLEYRSNVQSLAGRPMRRIYGDIHSCSVRSTSSAAVHSSNPFTSASAPPSPTSPSCSPGQPVRPASAPCGSRHNQSVPSTHPSRGTATSTTPASSRHHRHPAAPCHQCRRSRGLPRSHHGSRRVHHHRQRSATDSTMSALTTPVEQCPARTVNRMQTLPWQMGAIKKPSSGCTSRQSACGLKAAGTTSFSRMIPCAEDTTSPSHSQLPFNEFIVWYLSEIQCFPVSSRSLVDTLMQMCIHPSLPMTVYGCSALTAQKGCVPQNKADQIRPVGTHHITKSRARQSDSKAPTGNHTTKISTCSSISVSN
ncbi:hypothetical protein TCDM_11465 [Trypanosoma cruzi Dm28c]|uniref:Uncharacterized protein n=1 Tax=Trypanosoma cruzi Dm28c TaxID=1416333 RepID=V5D0K6_TRYCR|nr:hypothetical protein TCDM_11465 [Trypanosoma cruzi Dm28c]